jgi:hypothetical protein
MLTHERTRQQDVAERYSRSQQKVQGSSVGGGSYIRAKKCPQALPIAPLTGATVWSDGKSLNWLWVLTGVGGGASHGEPQPGNG